MARVDVRPARPDEAPLVLAFIRDLAEYEKLLHEVRITLDDVRRLLFADHPRAFCDIAELDGAPVGFAFWFYNVSTFEGRCGIYLEDLFVRPEARGAGAGKALMAALARRCRDENLGRLEWAVLDWNAPSIAFYDSLGATAKTDWITRRLSGDALLALAAS
ncbi:MAG TPA: GNAT family N-acetyltransferase [Caulobacteraceae bacterium]|nr:GNAT family N-acetyltransferase [Caulobacteraceae bacterium]